MTPKAGIWTGCSCKRTRYSHNHNNNDNDNNNNNDNDNDNDNNNNNNNNKTKQNADQASLPSVLPQAISLAVTSATAIQQRNQQVYQQSTFKVSPSRTPD